MGRTKGRHYKRYAVWQGDTCLAIGTLGELAERFRVKVETVKWWASPSAKRRDKGKAKIAERI